MKMENVNLLSNRESTFPSEKSDTELVQGSSASTDIISLLDQDLDAFFAAPAVSQNGDKNVSCTEHLIHISGKYDKVNSNLMLDSGYIRPKGIWKLRSPELSYRSTHSDNQISLKQIKRVLDSRN